VSKNHRIHRMLFLLLILALFIGISSGASAQKLAQGQDPEGPTPVGVTDVEPAGTLSRGSSTLPDGFKAMAAAEDSSERSVYIIRLQAPSVAQYEGGIADLKPTSPRATGEAKLDMSSPESVAYAEFLERGRENFINAMNNALGREVTVTYQYYATLNGLAVELTAQEVLVVADLPNVAFIQPDELFELQTNAGPEWINADAIWAGVGGMAGTFGEGVIVGVIDGGINPDHPSFADIGGDGYDHTNPWGAGNYAGVCDPGDATYDPTFPCNDKLIGAWGFPTVNGGDPTDQDGHGSHTASTAAGNVVFGATVNTPNGYVVTDGISGVAPHANVVAYHACCTGSALSAARDQVVIDGVDVVNYSIGSTSPTPDPWNSSFALQWLAVRDAGIFVATSAGNSGNGFATVGSPGDLPWMTTIGASTHDLAYVNSVINMSGGDTTPPADIEGRSVTIGYGPAPVVYAADFGDAMCLNPFPASTFSGEIVICDRGVNARVGKGANVLAGGAGGMILAEVTPGGIGALASDTHVLPAVHITDTDGDALKAWLSTGSGHMATINGTIMDQAPGNGDIMAKFSSRGANRALPDIVKPDVTAPGVGIMAAFNDGVEYNIIQGTSMSSPHVAGAGALLKALHPDWTPAEIQSALMTTASTSVVDNDGVTPADPFAMGGGRVDLAQAGVAGLLLDETAANFEAANPADGGVPSSLNLPSMGEDQCVGTCSWTRTVENVLSTAGTWSASTSADAGISISVSPSSFTLNPGETQEIVVTADVTGAPEGEWLFGTVYLSEASGLAPDTHMPVAAAFSPGSLPQSVDIVTRRNAGSQLATGLRAIEITDLTTTMHGLAKGDVTEERLVSDPTIGDPYDGGFDPLVDGTFFVTVDVPTGTVSFIAETIFSESSDLDLFVGSGNVPSLANQLCTSTSPSAVEFCELANPAAGTYWILVQNWSSSNGPALPGELSTLVTAVVPEADGGNMSVTGPSSVPGNEPFEVRVFWDTPTMAAGDRWYGSFDLGSDPGNPGNIGTIPVLIERIEDDVTKSVSQDTAVAGDTLTYDIVVQPNVTPEDLVYSVSDTIPDGMTYVAGSATATSGVVDVTGDTLTWSGVMAVPELEYLMTTSATDPLCDTGFGGYIDLEAFGIMTNPGVSGDTVGFTAFSTGNLFNYYGNEYAGLSFTDDGFAIFDINTNYGGTPWNAQAIPNADLPNNVLPMFWYDFEIFYDAALNHGVSLATAGPDLVVVEYDDIQPWGGGSPVMDFEIVMTRAVNNAPGAYEIVYAYDNINAIPGPATIGVENANGTAATTLVNAGDASGVISNGFQVCFDQVGAADPAVISYQVTVDTTAPGVLTNNVVHDTDNPGSLPAATDASVTVVHGALNYCAYAEGNEAEVEDNASLDCSVAGKQETEIEKYASIGGDVISYDNEVEIEEYAEVSGNVTAQRNVEVDENGFVGSDVLSGRNIYLKENAVVAGDATAAHRVKLDSGAVVSGTITTGADVTIPLQPAPLLLSVSAGGLDVQVAMSDTLDLAPGSYGELKVKEGATLNLSAGEYAFEEIEVKKNATVNIDLSSSPNTIVIEVEGDLEMDEGTQMHLTGSGGAEDILIVATGHSVELNKQGVYLGTFLAPSADVELEEYSTLEGMLFGKEVEVKKWAILTGAPAIDLFADHLVSP
jgi:uncharacterized repeat protein (TIGR01451 family)